MPFCLNDRVPCESDGYNKHEGGPVKVPSTLSPKDYKPHLHFEDDERESILSATNSPHPRSSIDTYDCSIDSEDDLYLGEEEDRIRYQGPDYIPPLPSYNHEIPESDVRPSTSKDFAGLFPSMDRLSIRHDDFTSDGNMNLRVDTVAPGTKRTAVQLFHLRMYDLAKREFSLRRYCRDSGREVCNSKRIYAAPTPTSRPAIQRSMSSALKLLSGAARPSARRLNSSSSAASNGKRPATARSAETSTDVLSLESSRNSWGDCYQRSQPRVTNAIRLEFSNYARVDVDRKGSRTGKRYEFSWWGHRYAWERVAEKHMDGIVSFHLIRDGQSRPVAHIVPETRSPSQVDEDERVGGWIPPCHMWISDHSVLNAATDVADVIIASGLIALVDDCIKERWQTKKKLRLPVLKDMGSTSPRAIMQRVFNPRRVSSEESRSPLRNAEAITAC